MTAHPVDRLLPHLRGELAAAERAAVDSHLAGCAACRDAARDFAALAALISRAPESAPPMHWGAFRSQLHAKLERRHRPAGVGRRWSLGPLPAALAAGLAAVLLYLGVLGPGGTTPGGDQATLEGQVLAGRLEVVTQLDLVQDLDLLEDFDDIDGLDSPGPSRES
jgi:anti-sigma factor RsiW